MTSAEELAINLIEEDDRRLTILGLFEKQPQLTFSFSNPFRQAIRSFPHEERCDSQPESSQISDSIATREVDSQIFLPSVLQLAARALANNVLPVPGGPWNSTPRGGVMAKRSKTSG